MHKEMIDNHTVLSNSNAPLLSIIVPVYKVEKYIRVCLESILRQTFVDFELLLIDDGSPDQCGKICDEYAIKDARIKVLHQTNHGVSAARNAGLNIAKGQYIGFVDADDWLDPTAYEVALRASQNAYDIVTFGVRSIEGDRIATGLAIDREFQSKELLAELVAQPNRIGGGVVNKIFKRSILTEVRFPMGIPMCEDRIFLYDAYSKAKDCKSLSSILYTINGRSDSATRVEDPKSTYSIIHGDRVLLRRYWAASNDLLPNAIDKYMSECMYYIPIIRKQSKTRIRPFRLYVFCIKMSMLWETIHGLMKHVIKKPSFHSYLVAVIKL